MQSRKSANIHFDGANDSRVIEADHYVKSENGAWVTVWTDWAEKAHNGQPDMTIPRERISMIERRDAERETSESNQETTREVNTA